MSERDGWDLRLRALPGLPHIREGDDLAVLIAQAADDDGMTITDGDVIVVAQKIVSKAEGRVVDLCTVSPGSTAVELARATGRDPRLCQLYVDEAEHIIEVKGRHVVTQDRFGMRNTSAGVDRSNAGPGGDLAVLLPVDPDASARTIRDGLHELVHADVAVIVSDTFGSPFRCGGIGAAIGIAGIRHLEEPGPDTDLDGKITSPQTNRVDELAAAASILMGQTSQALPVVVIRGAHYTRDEQARIAPLIIRTREPAP